MALDQIPSIGLKLVIDALGKAGRTVKMYSLLLTHEQTEQMIKAMKMIDMITINEDLEDQSYLP